MIRRAAKGFGLLLIVAACGAGGCEPEVCAGVDEGSLEAVTACYYAAGSNRGRSRFLSKASRDQVDQAKFDADVKVKSPFEILGTDVRDGAQYGRVAVVSQSTIGDRPCTETSTRTWVLEESRWRTITLNKQQELVEQSSRTGNYRAMVDAAAELLKGDPFSDEAHSALLFGHDRGQTVTQGSEEELTRAWLGVNPKASRALGAAVGGARDLTVATMFLERMPRDDCSRSKALFNFLTGRPNPEERLALLDAQAPSYSDPVLALARMKALQALGRKAELSAHLTPPVRARVEEILRARDPVFAAGWSDDYAAALIELGDPDAARTVLEAALFRVPDDVQLAALLRKLPPRTPTPDGG